MKLDGMAPPEEPSSCKNGNPSGIGAEYCRVKHYEEVVQKTNGAATLWGSDMNVRNQLHNGCPQFQPETTESGEGIFLDPEENANDWFEATLLTLPCRVCTLS